MNKRQKKKQLAVRYKKAYKGLRKYCQRRHFDEPKYDWYLPKFKKWKEEIIFQNRLLSIFGRPPIPIYPPSITYALISIKCKSLTKNYILEV